MVCTQQLLVCISMKVVLQTASLASATKDLKYFLNTVSFRALEIRIGFLVKMSKAHL